MTSRKPRVRIQIMLAAETAELVQKEASELGISVSAMGAVLIKRGLKTEKEEKGPNSAKCLPRIILFIFWIKGSKRASSLKMRIIPTHPE